MLATTLARPYPPTYVTHPVQLPGGGAELLEFFIRGDSGKHFASHTYVRTWSRSGRVVGILSPTAPPPEALTTLSPSASYVVGEQLEALGTVAFVLFAPQEQLFDDKERAQPSLMPAPGTGFLTLYAPDGPVDVELGFGVGAMQFRCDCRVEAEVRSLHRWPERPPGGTDGGNGH
ncbi:hypothetical protein ATI61_109374 [Archangium gephyra]|uniref:Uncharacterized protein n=2 Tax=Archangium gephyra TaxID=48 RepID=A0AAC8Q317_9BACT|nr:Hypothetical protein AA314_01050 [Archangium gephyra]REG28030.1 hypothetical protein ATI61_109374 [Archangium gephyra]